MKVYTLTAVDGGLVTEQSAFASKEGLNDNFKEFVKRTHGDQQDYSVAVYEIDTETLETREIGITNDELDRILEEIEDEAGER